MKSTYRVLMLLLLAVLLLATAMVAQTADPIVRVSVPFEFQVGNRALPAGDYSIVRAGAYILELRNARNEVVATAVTTPAQTPTPFVVPKLVFQVEDGHSVLTRVWAANTRYGYEFPAPSRSALYAKTKAAHVQTAAGR